MDKAPVEQVVLTLVLLEKVDPEDPMVAMPLVVAVDMAVPMVVVVEDYQEEIALGHKEVSVVEVPFVSFGLEQQDNSHQPV